MTPGERARAAGGVGWVEAAEGTVRAIELRADAIIASGAERIAAQAARARESTFTIPGVVRVKKNSLRRVKRGNRVFTVSSEAHEAWENTAVLRLQSQRHRAVNPKGWGALNLRALIYLDREPGRTNLDNLIASVMDALQKAEVVPDDCVIRGLDGSRIRLDRKNPRCEIVLTPLND